MSRDAAAQGQLEAQAGLGRRAAENGADHTLLDRLGAWMAARLQSESSGYQPYTPSDPDTLRRVLLPGDVLLVEGNLRLLRRSSI